MSCVIVISTLQDRQREGCAAFWQRLWVIGRGGSAGDFVWGGICAERDGHRRIPAGQGARGGPPQTQLFHPGLLTGVEGGRSGKARPNCWVSLSSSREHGAGNSSNSRPVGSLQSLTAERGKEAGRQRELPPLHRFSPLPCNFETEANSKGLEGLLAEREAPNGTTPLSRKSPVWESQGNRPWFE